MVHERSDQLAALLSCQLALKKSRHRFPESLCDEQRRGQQHGERVGHLRRVSLNGGRVDEFNSPNDEEGTAGGEADSFDASKRRRSQTGSLSVAIQE